MKRPNYFKLTLAILITCYYIWYASADPQHVYANWNIIDSADLIIHEAGHTIFIFFGTFLNVFGGSFLQIFLPCVFSAYFFKQGKPFSGSILIFWVAQNVLYVATYMGDAVLQQLPLLGGDSAIHDWNYLLTNTGLLQYTDILSSMTRFVGFALIVVAALLCFQFSFETKKSIDGSGYELDDSSPA